MQQVHFSSSKISFSNKINSVPYCKTALNRGTISVLSLEIKSLTFCHKQYVNFILGFAYCLSHLNERLRCDIESRNMAQRISTGCIAMYCPLVVWMSAWLSTIRSEGDEHKCKTCRHCTLISVFIWLLILKWNTTRWTASQFSLKKCKCCIKYALIYI